MSNIIVNVIIICVVTWLVNYLRNEKKRLKQNDACKSIEKGEFVIEYGIVLRIITILAGAFFIPVFIINLGNWLLGWEIGKGSDFWTVFIFGIAVILTISMFLGIFVWKVTVCENGSKIIYRGYFGRKHTYLFAELDKVVEKKNGDLIAYQNGKKVFTISENLPLGPYFMFWAMKHKKLIQKNK